MTAETPNPVSEDAGFRKLTCPHIAGPDAQGWIKCGWSTTWQEPPYPARYAAAARYRAHFQAAHMPDPIISVVESIDA